MKNLLVFVRCLLLCFLCILSLLVSSAFGQITLIPNPDGGSYTDDYNNRSPFPYIQYKNALYGQYVDANQKLRLAKYDGTSITLIPNPDNNRGIFGQLFVFNDAIYMQYLREIPYPLNPSINIGIGQIAKYDGQTLKLLDNPDYESSGVGSGFTYPALFSVFNGSLYGRYMDAKGKFRLAKIDSGPVSSSFAITGVTSVSCTVVTTTERRLTFTPLYTGLTDQPVSFSVVNELLPTLNPGPYSLRLYIDNPTITLKATQTGTLNDASYVLNWLPYCPNGGRRVANESPNSLNVTIMPNPGSGQTVDVVVEGVPDQPVTLQVVDQQGKSVSQMQIEQASSVERRSIHLGATPGVYILKVNTPIQVKTLKVIRQ